MFKKVLIANRGVAAIRIAGTLRDMGIKSVGVRSESERDAGYFDGFDEVVELGVGGLKETYLNQGKLIELALSKGADAIHPGYGFLSENSEFAQAVADSGLVFIGPKPAAIRSFGLKHEARRLAQENRVAMLPGSGLLSSENHALEEAERIGYPVIMKSSAGGGGIGMQACHNADELKQAYDSVRGLAAANFASNGVFVEKLLIEPRHIEVQVFGDGAGGVLILGDRDCSLQRRNQKLVEECPAPNLDDILRRELHDQARRLLASVHYESAGTVEFLYDPHDARFYFLEVNTRIQVEHGVTERVYGVDLVRWMIEQACGELGPLDACVHEPKGAAIQARFYAEDPYVDFRPSPGCIDVDWPVGVRVDTWLTGEDKVSHQFDPLLANVIGYGESRDAARVALVGALKEMRVYGISTNRSYLTQALEEPEFCSGAMSTGTLAGLDYRPREIEVIEPGFQTQVQAYPGRQGFWEVGVPPSGPMDDLSFRLANRLLGNAETAAGLECTFSGPTLRFRHEVRVVLCGAHVEAMLDGNAVPVWTPFEVPPGGVLQIGEISQGMRCYLAVTGGLDCRETLGSMATFTLGRLGGHDGRCLKAADVIRWKEQDVNTREDALILAMPPDLTARKSIRLLLGPHTTPDFFTQEDMEGILQSEWKIHHNSSRTGVRLIGPKPDWARNDGGEAGLHPSNIHDNAYAFGAVDFTGDMPVILGPDGPSLGGFVCPGVVINADRWKLGQLQPGDVLRFQAVSEAEATSALQTQLAYLLSGEKQQLSPSDDAASVSAPILWHSQHEAGLPVVMRRAGQEWLLLEFGAPVLDLRIRAVIHHLIERIRDARIAGIVEMTPGIRSLQVRFDWTVWRYKQLINVLRPLVIDVTRGAIGSIPSRRIRMPLSWDDPACKQAVERYMKGVRPDAPWCPDNIEFIRRINGLASTEAVRQMVFGANYIVMGLGDVYLGAPVMTPLDPMHRLVTTKYNPARTWTAENSVGIGGAYACIYGMEGPGGYQFIGRTTPVWRTQGVSATQATPWLLHHFDQVEFYPVDPETLLELRAAAKRGGFVPEIEAAEFNLEEHEASIQAAAADIAAFQANRTRAFAEEMEKWRAAGLHSFVEPETSSVEADVTPDAHVVQSPMAASVWKVNQAAAEKVTQGAEMLLLEAMKSEVKITAPFAGSVEFLVTEGDIVDAGQPLALIR